MRLFLYFLIILLPALSQANDGVILEFKFSQAPLAVSTNFESIKITDAGNVIYKDLAGIVHDKDSLTGFGLGMLKSQLRALRNVELKEDEPTCEASAGIFVEVISNYRTNSPTVLWNGFSGCAPRQLPIDVASSQTVSNILIWNFEKLKD